MLRLLLPLGCLLSTGCSMLPDIAHQPTFHNPLPELSKVAIAPFFNASDEPSLNGKDVALAYFNELQLIPGFEVVPVGVVERAMLDHDIQLSSPTDARRLAQLLEVDALVVGSVTDYCPYYPQRLSLHVEWYAANPNLHPIPPGYGLPWGTAEEQGIPASLVFEAEMALAKAQLKTQSPPYKRLPEPDKPLPVPQQQPPQPDQRPQADWPETQWGEGVTPMQHEAPADATTDCASTGASGFPADWPDPRGFIPRLPQGRPSPPCPSQAPVIQHTRMYNAHDMQFTKALKSYYFFRDDARFGGPEGYTQRSDDFFRFCCHMHIAETLTARGGAGETRVVWRWPTIR